MPKLLHPTLTLVRGSHFVPSEFRTTQPVGQLQPPKFKLKLRKRCGVVGQETSPVSQPNPIPYQNGTFFGFGEITKRVKIKIDDKRMMGIGLLYALNGDSSTLRSTTMLPALRYRTPGYEYDAERDGRVHCTSRKTDEQYLFIGYLEEFQPEVDVPSRVEALEATHENPELTISESIGKEQRKNRRSQKPTLADELLRIGSLRTAGLDPDVDMQFLIAYLRESRATIYRKSQKKQFPPSQKRGGSVFWRLSVIERYRLGQWVAETDLGVAATHI